MAKNELQRLVREKMEEIKSPSSAPYVAVCADYFNKLLHDKEYWTNPNEIKQIINFSFPSALTEEELSAEHDLRTDIDIPKLFARLQTMTGVKVRADV